MAEPRKSLIQGTPDSTYPKQLSKEQIEALRRPLPPEAIKPHPTKPYLSTIKAIYVIERLNEVFGIGKWRVYKDIIKVTEPEYDSEGKLIRASMVVLDVNLRIPEYDIEISNYGGNDNPDLGDAFKGARTDALTKICSELEIGMPVFKGLTEHAPANDAKKPYARPSVEMNKEAKAKFDPTEEVVKFGKNIGKRWIDLPQDYLEWALTQDGALKSKAEITLAASGSYGKKVDTEMREDPTEDGDLPF